MSMLNVLHVDDESDIREIVELSLSFDPDIVTRSCSSGEEALSLMLEWLPHIILLDVMMPVMDGPATLARLRHDSRTARIPVLFMTARVQARELDFFLSLGAAGVIAKPFDPMMLAASVRAQIPPAVYLDVRLEVLRSVFLRRVDDEAIELMKCRATILRGDGSSWSAVRRIAHGLAGAGGIFGFPEISNAAAALEDAVILSEPNFKSEEAMFVLDCLLVCIEANRHQREKIQSQRKRSSTLN